MRTTGMLMTWPRLPIVFMKPQPCRSALSDINRGGQLAAIPKSFTNEDRHSDANAKPM